MKLRNWYCLVFNLFFVLPAAHALQASPQEALEEMATAKTADAVVRHLPAKLTEYLQKLPAKEKAAVTDRFLLGKQLERGGGKLVRSDDGSGWELVEKEGHPKTLITFKNTYLSGVDALVEIEIGDERHQHAETLFIGMRLEDSEWRVAQMGRWEKKDLADTLMPKEEHTANIPSQAAAAMLRTLNTCIVTYETTYPEQGIPASLQALSGRENQESTVDHAMLLDPNLVVDPLVKNGYEFHYLRIDEAHYQITAIPQQWVEGSRSLFTDETATIRFTLESRPANAQDPPLED
jgi:hypothetical protein